jgi:hypothetical protein
LKSGRTLGVGKYLKRQELSRCFQKSARQSITLLAARAFALARFAFSNQTVLSSASFRLMKRIEGCDSKRSALSRGEQLGWTLVAVGALTTIPLVLQLFSEDE